MSAKTFFFSCSLCPLLSASSFFAWESSVPGASSRGHTFLQHDARCSVVFVLLLSLFVYFNRQMHLALGCKFPKYLERFCSGCCRRRSLRRPCFSHHGMDNDSHNGTSIQQCWPLVPLLCIPLWCIGLSHIGHVLDTGLILTTYYRVFLSYLELLPVD